MTTAVQLQLRRDTAANLAAATPAAGEPGVDTTRNRLVVGDGSTLGGWPHAKLKDAQGYGFVANCGLKASIASNNLTINLVTAAGNNPSAADSIFVPFRTAPAALTETPQFVEVTAATSIQISAGDTLGTANGVPFRICIVLYGNGILGAINCVLGGAAPTGVFPLDESMLVSPASTIGNSAGVFYSAAAVPANSPFRIVGFVEYGLNGAQLGLATAGTYNANPTKLQLLGPGVHRPGDTIGRAYSTTNSTTAISGADVATALSAQITPTSVCSLIRVQAAWSNSNSTNAGAIYGISRGSGPTYIGSRVGTTTSGTSIGDVTAMSAMALDAPASKSAVTYKLYGTQTNAACQFNGTLGGIALVAAMTAEEIAA